MSSNRIEKLIMSFNETLEAFGDSERSMNERRKLLKQLRDMEQELDKHYKLEE